MKVAETKRAGRFLYRRKKHSIKRAGFPAYTGNPAVCFTGGDCSKESSALLRIGVVVCLINRVLMILVNLIGAVRLAACEVYAHDA